MASQAVSKYSKRKLRDEGSRGSLDLDVAGLFESLGTRTTQPEFLGETVLSQQPQR